jgi:hypothetical protein
MNAFAGAGLVAHQGGWDELLIIAGAGLVILVAVLPRIREERRREARAAEPASGPCAYCDAMIEAELRRCPACGFRARRVRAA